MKQETKKTIICHFDGATEPTNPGGAMGMGARVMLDNEELFTHSGFMQPSPFNTNNIAEYMAFEKILDFFLEYAYLPKDVVIYIYGDSKLVIQQMRGLWKIKGGMYLPYAKRCKEKLTKLSRLNIIIDWVPREKNSAADVLSKAALIEHGIQFRIQPQEYR